MKYVLAQVAAVLVGLIVFGSACAIGFFSCGGALGKEAIEPTEELDDACFQRWVIGGGVVGVVVALVPAAVRISRTGR